MKEQKPVSLVVPGVPATDAEGSGECAAAEAFDNGFSFSEGSLTFDDSPETSADPDLFSDPPKLLSEGHRIGWAMVKETREITRQLHVLNSLLLGISQQAWNVKLGLIQPLKIEKPRRKAKAKEKPAAAKQKAAKAPKPPKAPKAPKTTKKGNEVQNDER